MTNTERRQYILDYIRNSSVEAFTNLRLQTALLELNDDLTASQTTDAADFTALSALSGANYKYVFVTDEGVFKYLSSGTPNGTTIFAASGGGTWNLVFNAGVDTPQLSTPVITLTVISDTQINATWASVTDAANYQLYRATESDFGDETLVYNGALLLFNSTGLTPDTTYYFRLRARGYERMNSAFDSDSAATEATPQLETPTLSAVADGSDQIDVTIGSVTDAENYIIEYSLDGVSGWTEIYNESTAGEFNHTGLDSDTQYFYRGYVTASGFVDSEYATDDATTETEVASELTDGLVAKYTFVEGGGQIAFNKAGSNTEDHNLIHPSEQQWTGESNLVGSIFNRVVITGTNNYRANALGDVQMRRIVTQAGTGDVPGFGALAGERIQGKTFPAGPLKIALEVISNTGSAQNMRMQIAGGAYSSDLPVGTTHGRVSFITTHPGGSPLVYYAVNDSAGNPLDISIDKIYVGDPAYDYVEPNFDLKFGELGTAGADDPTWVPDKGIATASDAQFAYGMKAVPVTFTNISVHTVQKITASSTKQNVIFGTKYADGGFEIGSGPGSNVDSVILPHFKFRNQQAQVKLSKFADGLYHHFCGTYDGTNLKFYADGLLMATFAVSLTSTTINRLLANHSPLVGNVGGAMETNFIALYNVAHTQAEVLQEKAWLDSQMSLRGITIADLPNVLAAEGDSLTIDVNNPVKKGLISISTSCIAENFATVGAQISTLEARWPTVRDWLLQFPGKNRILHLWIGANDLTNGGMDVPAWVARVKAYCVNAKADVSDLQIVFCTTLPNATGSEKANRAVAIPLQVADPTYYDSLVRFDLVSGVGADGDETNATYYLGDQVHLTNAGNNQLYSTWAAGFTTLLV